jgi:hypothetical protein
MAGVAGNFYVLYIGRQTAKGVAQTTPQYGLKVTGGDINVDKTEVELQETDSTRQGGRTVVTAAKVGGSPDLYVRPDDFGLLAYGLLGVNADSGTNPNYIHTATMSSSAAVPYFTIYKTIGGTVLVDQYVDCRITGCKIKGQAGQPITASWDIAGLTPTLGATSPVTVPVTQDPLVYPQCRVQIAGSAPGTVESWEIDMMNNPDVIQADNSLFPFDVALGRLQVSGTYTMLFQSDADYRTFFTGSPTGTVPSTALNTERLDINIVSSAFLGIDLTFQSVAVTAYPVSPDVAGKPLRVAVGWRAQPDATLANYVKVVTNNGIISY